MATAKFQPELRPMANALKVAMARAGLGPGEVGKALGVTSQSVSGWRNAKASISPAHAEKLARLLKVDAAVLVKPGKAKPTGPAQRAVALHMARMNGVQVLPPAPGKPPERAGVFGMEVKSDGTMHIWMRATLPLDKGTTLLRALLDMNIVDQEPTAHDRGAQDTE
jgi:transcriptional regulator with XRE-family HTH domain